MAQLAVLVFPLPSRPLIGGAGIAGMVRYSRLGIFRESREIHDHFFRSHLERHGACSRKRRIGF